MNYIALVSLVLGLISIIITIKYVDSYDKLNYILKKNCSKKGLSEFPQILINIQDQLNLTDKDFISKLDENKNKIIDIIKETKVKKEKFTNYIPYITSQKRNLKKKRLSGIIKPYKIVTKNPAFTYTNDVNLAKKAIKYQPKYKSFTKYKNIQKLENKSNNFNKRNLCLVQHDSKNYCFPTREKEYCIGIYGKNFNECSENY